MNSEVRQSGINILGNVSWGTHFCQFYQTKEDLIDILVPYFKAGLGNNEYCMWITSEPLKVEEAKTSLKKAVKNLDKYIKRGQIEILDYSQWYTKSGKFERDNVLQGWVKRESQALKRGFDGLRLTGNTLWLEKKQWRNFAAYEEEINKVIGKYRIIALCTYSLYKCSPFEIIDVLKNHQFTLIKRERKWEQIESFERKQAEQAFEESEERYHQLVEILPNAIAIHRAGKVLYINTAGVKLLGAENSEQIIGKSITDFLHPDYLEIVKERLKQMREEGAVAPLIEEKFIKLDGTEIEVEAEGVSINYQGKPATLVIVRDLTERKREEEALKESEQKYQRLSEEFRGILDCNQDNLTFQAPDLKIIWANRAAAESIDKTVEDIIGKHCYKLWHNRDKPCKGCPLISATKHRLPTFGEMSTPDGRFWEVRAFPLLENNMVRGLVEVARDITERKQAEEKYRKAQERFTGIYDSSKDAIGYANLEGILQDVNDSFCRLTGYSREELLSGRKYQDITPREYHKYEAKIIEEVLSTGKPVEYEKEYIRKDGSLVPILLTTFIVKGTSSKPLGIAAIIKDITERKRAEEMLQESEENFRALAENTLEGILVVKGKEARIVYANKRAAEITGYSITELLNIPLKNLLPPDESKKIIERYRRRLKDDYVPMRYETLCLRKDSNIIPVEAAATKTIWKGEPADMGFFHDITVRKKAEEALRESEEKYRTLADNINIGLYRNTPGPKGKFLEANPAIIEMFGYMNRDEFLAINVSDLYQTPAERKRFNEELLKKGFVRDKELLLKKKDGTQFIASVSAVAVKDKTGNVLYYDGIIEDITERKRVENEIRDYQKKLRSLASKLSLTEERERRNIAAFMHDQIGQKLSLARIKLGALSKSLAATEYDKPMKEIRDLIEETIQDARTLTFELSPPILYELGLESSIEWLIEQFREKHRIQFDFKTDGKPKPLGLEISVVLFQSVRELLINAVKYSKATIVRASLRRVRDKIKVSVEDDGIGFDASLVQTYSVKTGGFGLFNIRERLEDFGGKLDIKSRIGQGTQVTMLAPLALKKGNS